MILEIILLALAVIFKPEETRAFTNQADVTDSELGVLGEALWALDTNNVYNLINVNVQGATTSSGRDNAPGPLLRVDPEAYKGPTISKLIALQDNYIPDVGVKEVITPAESLEESQFLDAIIDTPVMKKAEQFLKEKGYIFTPRSSPRNQNTRVGSSNTNVFRDTLKDIWFTMYSRQNNMLGSSGFEHSFIGEIKNGEISGFHNWAYFARQEESGKVNYDGQMRIIGLGRKGMVLKFHFKWGNSTKPVNAMFIGTSPEFEMAVYTICFFARPGARCPMKFGGKSVPIKTFYFTKAGKRLVASAYPEI